jgi:hypothetical protein
VILGWIRADYVASEGTLEDSELLTNFMCYLERRKLPFRYGLFHETIEDYLDYLFEVMEYYTPEGKYFGTPNDHTPDVFGYFSLPDVRKN